MYIPLVFIISFIFIMKGVVFTIKSDNILINLINKCLKIAFYKNELSINENKTLFISVLKFNEYTSFIKTLENVEFKNNYFDWYTKFNNFTIQNTKFTNTDLSYCSFNNCNLNNIDFFNSYLLNTHFNKCKILNINFEKIKLKVPFFSIKLTSAYRKKRISFKDLNKKNIDTYTINSLKRLIQKQNLEVGKDIVGDEWLMEELKKPIKEIEDKS